jgi:2-dehydropantoate 2-reductase
MGAVGSFIAHSLRGIVPNPPPVSLIFHKHQDISDWEKSEKRLSLVTDGDIERREGFEVELALPRPRYHKKEIQEDGGDSSSGTSDAQPQPPTHQLIDGESSEPINSLIICTKATRVLQALSGLKHRLHPESVILFLQNGMGIVEEVDKEIFPDPETRPHYMVGINSHGMHSTGDKFTTVHAGFGTISLGILPHERNREPGPYAPVPKFQTTARYNPLTTAPKHAADPDPLTPEASPSTFRWTPNHRYLLRTLLRSPVLGATAYSPPDLLQMQLEKLAVNCIVNPLTVMLDHRNGSILYNYAITRTIRLLLSEISLVIRSLPELQHIPNVQQRFDPARLETIVVGVAHRTRDNISSMLADVRAGRQTEIEFINGWVVKKGEEQGVRCLMNYMLMCMVKGKGNMIQMEIGEGIPFVDVRAGTGEGVVVVKENQSQEEVPFEKAKAGEGAVDTPTETALKDK